MQQKNDLTEAKAAEKVRKTRNNRDSALLHFMFIRDEIAPLPRPRQDHLSKKLGDDQTDPPLEQVKRTSAKRCQEELAEERKLNDRLIERLEAYELAIQKIDLISLDALSTIYDVQVGGRKPKQEINETANALAKIHLQKNKKLPTSKELHYAVSKDAFKKDPQEFIRIVSQVNDMDRSVVLQNSRDPSWDYWKHVPGLTSDRAMSAVLTKLRNAGKKNQQK
jgi:hypothetical protein